MKDFLTRIRWIFFVTRRFSRVDRDSRALVTGVLSSLGICFGVMTLIVTLSVMNGFQRAYIDSIMEISSSHIRFEAAGDAAGFVAAVSADPEVVAVTPFFEAQTLMTGLGKISLDRQQAAVVRAVPGNIAEIDAGFAREADVRRGSFDLSEPSSIVLGSALAGALGVTVGDSVNFLALSGGADVDLISSNRVFTVTGIFRSGYADINAAYCFISLEDGQKYFGTAAKRMFSVKVKNYDHVNRIIARLRPAADAQGISGTWESWQSYNRAFFGALRVEKNILMLFVFIIFVVVGVNIYNGMRRMVYERRTEIAVFQAIGGRRSDIQGIFILRGFLTGFFGAFFGLVLGLLICVRMDLVFALVSGLSYYSQYFFASLFNSGALVFLRENPMYQVYGSIPARMQVPEILLTTIFGIFSALAAAWAASLTTLNTQIAEVLHDE
ncbi:MAG: ABC transporter permease [Spirochaetaceae bacterium]|jgi:lipoprotein-releasing system permease protein|nr:ABC transporter permease [Spirochaetaceae bacterium]